MPQPSNAAKRARHANAKGGAFERSICRALSLWVSNGQDRDLFWRSAMSGGSATIAAKTGTQNKRQAGDLSAISPEGHALTDRLLVECKFRRDLNFSSLLRAKGFLWTVWVAEAEKAQLYGKSPLLIAKQNHWPIVACMYQSTVQAFEADHLVCMTVVDVCGGTPPMHIMFFDNLVQIPFRAPNLARVKLKDQS